MIETVLKEYQYNRGMVYLMLTNAIMFAIIGIVNLFGNPFFAVIWLGGSLLWGINFLFIKKAPLIRITTQRIIVFRGPLRSPMIVHLEKVSMIQRDGKNKLYLVLLNKARIKISLFGINETERTELTQEIESVLKGLANHTFHSDGNSTALHCHR